MVFASTIEVSCPITTNYYLTAYFSETRAAFILFLKVSVASSSTVRSFSKRRIIIKDT